MSHMIDLQVSLSIRRGIARVAVLLVALSFASACSSQAPVTSDLHAGQSFDSADAAADALVTAAEAKDDTRLAAIFGPDGADLLHSGDAVADDAALERFAAAAREKRALDKTDKDRVVLNVGNDDWPFPIPLVKSGKGWRYDVNAGKEELLNRRIGRNELAAVNAALAYVGAQRDFAERMRAARGTREYAQKIRSTAGRHDGLFWEVREGERESPLGPAFADASREGYEFAGAPATPQPFHGYIYRVLTGQGANAPGGKKSYLRGERMRDGFALVAFPAQYGSSGIMTFIVNQQGVVFQKDLGEGTNDLARNMSEYDPDDSWDPVEPVDLPDDDADDAADAAADS
jgi:hypothetical protein